MNCRAVILALFALLSGSGFATTIGSYTVLSSNILNDVNGVTITTFGGGLAFDGSNLWYTTYQAYTTNSCLYRINPATQTVTAQWPLPFEAHGIAWDGSQLRIADTKDAPRVRAYDRQGNLLGSQLVEADSSMFQGMAWDGTNLWGADDWFLLKFDATGAVARVHSSSWIKPYTVLTWDGTNLIAALGGGGTVVSIDPLTGNVSYPQAWIVGGGHCQIACGAGRMWFVNANGLGTQIYEVVVPAPAPLPPFQPTWGVFQLFDGFAVPQRSGYMAGAGLGACGADFWYSDAFNVSKVRWSARSVNTAALDLNWPIAGGADDVASDGTRVWLLEYYNSYGSAVYQMTMEGELVTNFFLPFLLPGQSNSGITWDGEALWVGGKAYTASGWASQVSRYSTNGRLLFGPIIVGAQEGGFSIDDLAWHNGRLWVNYYDYNPTIACIDPASGALLGRYPAGGEYGGFTGLAGDGTNLYAVGFPRFAGTNQPALGTWILRLGMPTNLVPPRLIGATTATNKFTFTFNNLMGNDYQNVNKTNCVLESPIGTLVNLPSTSSWLWAGNTNQIYLYGLSLTNGNTWRVTFYLVRDQTGNVIREDGIGNVLTGLIGGLTAPAEVTVTPLATNQSVISWRDASAGETGFRVERRSGAAGAWEQVADLPTTNGAGFGGAINYTNTVSAGADYYYRVYAYNTGSSAYSEVQTASPTPLPFTIKDLSYASDGRFTLRWNGAAGKTYRVLRSDSPAFETYDVVVKGIPGLSPVISFTDPTPKALGRPAVFYRLQVE